MNLHDIKSDIVRKLINALPLGVLVVNERGGAVYVNETFKKLTGLSKYSGYDWLRVIPQDQRSQLWAGWKLIRDYSDRYEIRTCIEVDGQRTPIQLCAQVVGDQDCNVILTFTDASEEEENHQRLQEALFFAEAIAETSPDYRYVYDYTERRTTWTNRPLTDALGYSKEQVLKMGEQFYYEITHPQDLDRIRDHYRELHSLPKGGYAEIEYRVLKADESTVWLRARHTVFKRDEDGKPISILGLCSDVTHQKELDALSEMYMLQAEEQRMELELAHETMKETLARVEELNVRLEELSVTDGLTKVRNRRSLEEFLRAQFDEVARYGRPLSFILLDVDKFKMFNDSFGHLAGDEVLIDVAKTLTRTARASDFVARYGGEEFAVVLPETDIEDAMTAVERFRAAIESGDWRHRQVTASFGVATFNGHDSIEALIRDADEALYHSKETGRNRCTHVQWIQAAA